MIVETAPFVLLENMSPGDAFEVTSGATTKVYVMTDHPHPPEKRGVVELATGKYEEFSVGSSFAVRPYRVTT